MLNDIIPQNCFVRNYINLLSDNESFLLFPYVKLKDIKNTSIFAGTCYINEYPCVLIVMNKDCKLGTMGYESGENITRAFEIAIKKKLPTICVTASGGARVHDGVISLMQMSKTSGIVKKHSDKGLLYISIITNPTLGGVAASFASLADIIIAEPDATYGFTGKRIVKETTGETLPKNFQSSFYARENGMVDMIVSKKNLKEQISNLFYLHKQNQRKY